MSVLFPALTALLLAVDGPPTTAPTPGISPAIWIAIAVVLVLLVIVALLVARARRRPPTVPTAPAKPTRVLPDTRAQQAQARAAVQQAEAALLQAQKDREAAEARAREEAAGRTQKEEAARKKAETEAAARAAAEARAAELKRQAQEAGTEEERKKAREAADKASAEAARRKRDQEEAERRANYEAKKAHEAEDKARRRAEDEAKRVADLEAVKKRAEDEAAEAAKQAARIEAESGRTLAEGLAKTRGGFMARLAELVGVSTTLDDRFIGELEEILFTADIGPRTATRMLDMVREKLKNKELSDPQKVRQALRDEILRILTLDHTYAKGGMPAPTAKPQVVMIVGVNGSGKTTTLGKLAFKERVGGRSVLLGAGDTFRAAAAEQLDVWAARAGVEIIKGPADSDPASVCFDAVKRAQETDRDLCLLDTAGRLHTQVGLMDELKKVRRVIEKALPGAPHETWLVVDGTTGQNGLHQARQFHESLKLTGLVLTKLDGTAKGGVVIGICDELKVPVRYVGVGEKIGDLRPFDPKEFVDALFAEA